MELFLTLVALYVYQCILFVETDQILIRRTRVPRPGRRLRGRVVRGGGRRLLPRWPGSLALVGGRSEPTEFAPPDVDALRTALIAVRQKTRALRLACELQAVLLFLALPLSIGFLGAEAALLFALPPLALVHLIGVGLLAWTGRRLAAEAGLGEAGRSAVARSQGERIAIALLYPPAMLRGAADLERTAFATRDGAAIAAALLQQEDLEAFLESEIGRARSGRYGRGDASDRIRAVVAWAEAREIAPRALMEPRRRDDGTATGYCPACGADYVQRASRCEDCRVSTVPYPEATA